MHGLQAEEVQGGKDGLFRPGLVFVVILGLGRHCLLRWRFRAAERLVPEREDVLAVEGLEVREQDQAHTRPRVGDELQGSACVGTWDTVGIE